MNQTVHTETLSQEVVEEASQKVAEILHANGQTGTGTGNGAAVIQAATPQPTPSAPKPALASRKKGKGKPVSQMATAADSNNRTIAITLPKDVADWYEQQASQAPFEPSVQKYIAWELRQIAANSKVEAAIDRAARQTTDESANNHQ